MTNEEQFWLKIRKKVLDGIDLTCSEQDICAKCPFYEPCKDYQAEYNTSEGLSTL